MELYNNTFAASIFFILYIISHAKMYIHVKNKKIKFSGNIFWKKKTSANPILKKKQSTIVTSAMKLRFDSIMLSALNIFVEKNLFIYPSCVPVCFIF